jgi:tRNA threonylcarbamoyladenosine biosynthesis protein TsaE
MTKNIFITNSFRQTQKLGELMAKELRSGEIVCLTGELGSGKTTFAQGILKGLGAKGPYTSPTFVVMKEYKTKFPISNFQFLNNSKISKLKKHQIQSIYHIDAYRVNAQDILDLGWVEIISGENNIVIVEWAERVKKIIPKNAAWLKFRHIESNKRQISVR